MIYRVKEEKGEKIYPNNWSKGHYSSVIICLGPVNLTRGKKVQLFVSLVLLLILLYGQDIVQYDIASSLFSFSYTSSVSSSRSNLIITLWSRWEMVHGHELWATEPKTRTETINWLDGLWSFLGSTCMPVDVK